jgi:hypothetical protein
MLRLRRAIVLLCLLAASMPMLLPFAFAARSSGGAAVQVLCTTHGVMWVVIDGDTSQDSMRYVQGAACPLCAAGAFAFIAPGHSVPPLASIGASTQLDHPAPLTLSTRHPWRFHLSPRAPPSA